MIPLPAPRAVAIALGCWAVVSALLLLLPLLAAAEGSGDPALSRPGSPAWWSTALVLTAQCVALLRVRISPRATLLVLAALTLLLGMIGPGTPYTLSHLPVLLAVLLAAARASWPRMWPVLAATALAVGAGVVLNGLRSGTGALPGLLGEGLVQGVGVVGLSALVALSLASFHLAREAQRRELAALTREREALRRAAASEERAAMARELHDIAAHHLSGIALLAAAADRQIDTDPSAAHAAVREVRSQTRSVLDDIRRVVGLLRGSGTSERTVETLESLPALVEARAEAGMDVRLVQVGPGSGRSPGTGLGPLAQLVAYRMVQESLSNAAAHAPGTRCLVTLDDTDPAHLSLTVTNGGGATAEAGTGGFGLLGMRERAELVGGRLEHGPSADGGWRVQLLLPRDLTAPAPAAQEGSP